MKTVFCNNVLQQLQPDVEYSGFAEGDGYNYYHIQTSSSLNIVITIVPQDSDDFETSDCAILILEGESDASMSSYDTMVSDYTDV